MNAIGASLANAGQGFASAFDDARKERTEFTNKFVGLGDKDQVKAAILRYEQTGDKSFINMLLNSNAISDEDRIKLNEVLYNVKNIKKSIKIKPGTILPDYNFNSNKTDVYFG